MADYIQTVDLERDDEIDLREIFFLFRKNFLKIVLATILGATAVFSVCCYVITPQYKATAKLYVVSASSSSIVNLNDLQIGTKLALDSKELILTRPMMESVIKKLQLENETVESLRESIEIENPSDTRILNISVTNPSPQKAADIANEVANMALTWLPVIMESNAPNIVEEAVVPSLPVAPHTIRNTAIAGIGCGLLLYVIFIVRFLCDDTIRTPEEMEKYFGAVPLAAIPLDKSVNKEIKAGRDRGDRK